MRRTRVAPDGPVPSLPQRGRAMPQDSAVFVGLDASKRKISVALAEDGRQGEVRFLGDVDHTPEAVRRLVTKLAGSMAGCCSATGRADRLWAAAPDLRPRARLCHHRSLADPDAAGRARQNQSLKLAHSKEHTG